MESQTSEAVEMVCPPCYPRIYAHSEAEYAAQYQAWLDAQKQALEKGKTENVDR